MFEEILLAIALSVFLVVALARRDKPNRPRRFRW